MQAEMDVLEAELAVLVSETEEEVVNKPGDGTVIPSRSAKPVHCTWVSFTFIFPPPHVKM